MAAGTTVGIVVVAPVVDQLPIDRPVLLLIAKGVMPVADAISKSGAVIRQPTHSAICWCRR